MFRLADLLVMLLYLLAMAGMGVYFMRRNTNTEEYFLGGRSFPGWAVGISMLGTSISSVTFLALPAAAYALDWRQLTPHLVMPFVAVAACFAFIPFFRRGKHVSAFEYLEERFGTGIRLYAAGYFLLHTLLKLAIVLYLLGLPIAAMTGYDEWIVLTFIGVVIAFYTVAGGISAVIWTDVVQTVILFFGGIFCLATVLFELPGGLSQAIAVGSEHGKFSLGAWDFSFGERTLPVMLLLGLVTFVGEFACNQNVVQRYIAARTMREARKATLLCGIMSLPTWGMFFLLGSCIYAYYQVFPSETVARLSADEVLPHFILANTWPGVGGLIIAACLAAGMSSLDSSINSIATVSTVDFLKKFRPGISDRAALRFAQLISLVAGALMIGGAIGISFLSRESVYDLSLTIGAVLCGATLTPFLLGFFTTRIGNRAILFGMAGAIVFSIYNILNFLGCLPDALRLRTHIYLAGTICNAVMLAAALIYSLVRPNRKNGPPGLTVWTLPQKAKKSPVTSQPAVLEEPGRSWR